VEAWKAIDEARITSLEQLKRWASEIGEMPGNDPSIARTIKDRLDRLAARRRVRVRLVFPKRVHRKTNRETALAHLLASRPGS
jgi:hypothetical protein